MGHLRRLMLHQYAHYRTLLTMGPSSNQPIDYRPAFTPKKVIRLRNHFVVAPCHHQCKR